MQAGLQWLGRRLRVVLVEVAPGRQRAAEEAACFCFAFAYLTVGRGAPAICLLSLPACCTPVLPPPARRRMPSACLRPPRAALPTPSRRGWPLALLWGCQAACTACTQPWAGKAASLHSHTAPGATYQASNGPSNDSARQAEQRQHSGWCRPHHTAAE